MLPGKEQCCCDMRGMLSFLILFLLSKKNMNGQQIAEEIAERKGSWPSPGTIYPALKGLRLLGLVKEKKSGKTVTYTLTEQGRETLRIAKRKFCQTFKGVLI